MREKRFGSGLYHVVGTRISARQTRGTKDENEQVNDFSQGGKNAVAPNEREYDLDGSFYHCQGEDQQNIRDSLEWNWDLPAGLISKGKREYIPAEVATR